MATWTKKEHRARLEAQRRWRAKNKKIVKPISQYWAQRRLMSLILKGIIIPEIKDGT